MTPTDGTVGIRCVGLCADTAKINAPAGAGVLAGACAKLAAVRRHPNAGPILITDGQGRPTGPQIRRGVKQSIAHTRDQACAIARSTHAKGSPSGESGGTGPSATRIGGILNRTNRDSCPIRSIPGTRHVANDECTTVGRAGNGLASCPRPGGSPCRTVIYRFLNNAAGGLRIDDPPIRGTDHRIPRAAEKCAADLIPSLA